MRDSSCAFQADFIDPAFHAVMTSIDADTFRRIGLMVALALLAALVMLTMPASPARAASSKACTDGGFRLINLTTGAVVASAGDDRLRGTIPATAFGPGDRFGVRGRYVEFDVGVTDFAIFDYAFTGAANELDITGGRRTPVFDSKVPDHRGLKLSSGFTIELDEEDLEASSGPDPDCR